MATRQQMLGMTAHQRHKFMMNQYVKFYGGKMPPPPKEETQQTDFDVLKDTYRWGTWPLCCSRLCVAAYVCVCRQHSGLPVSKFSIHREMRVNPMQAWTR